MPEVTYRIIERDNGDKDPEILPATRKEAKKVQRYLAIRGRKSIHPAILYRLEDSPLPQGDLYDIEGFSRNAVKLAFKSSNFNIEGNKPLICGMTLGISVG